MSAQRGVRVPGRSLDTAVTWLSGVGPARADALRRLGIFTVRDLFLHIPHRYEDASTVSAIAKLREFDSRLASNPNAKPETAVALRARGRLLVISEALTEHSSYFDMGALA